VAGFVLVTVGAMLAVGDAAGPAPPTALSPGLAALSLLLFAAAGFVTARLADRRPMHHVSVLGAISAFVAIVTFLAGTETPLTQQLAVLLLLVVGLPVGAWLAGSRR